MARLLVLVAAAAVLAFAAAAASTDSKNLPDPKFGNELAGLNYESIIGGPLNAVVKAQAMAAMQTVDFIMNIGFEPAAASGDGAKAPPKVRMMKFQYAGQNAAKEDVTGSIEVPLLTMIPIPYLRFETVDLEFNVKLNSMATAKASEKTSVDVTASVSGGFGPVNFDVKVSVSHQSESSAESSIQREYSMRVFVHATQAETPEGMMKVLDKLLEIAYMTTVEGPAEGSATS